MNIPVSCHVKTGIELSTLDGTRCLYLQRYVKKEEESASKHLHLHTNFYSAIWQETWTLERNDVLCVLCSGKEEELLNNNA